MSFGRRRGVLVPVLLAAAAGSAGLVSCDLVSSILAPGSARPVERTNPYDAGSPLFFGVVLSLPADGATEPTTAVALSWSAKENATAYHLAVATTDDFAATVLDRADVDLTAFTLGPSTGLLLADQSTYYWKVAALYPGGTESPWSEVRRFDVSLPVVTLSEPGNGLTISTLEPTLSWSAAANAASYRVVLDRDLTLSAPSVDVPGLTTPSLAVPQSLANFGTYYWRVATVDANGVQGQWSETRWFTPSGTYTIPRRTILMNGDRGEWDGIEPAAVDPAGDSTSGEAGSDVTELYIAADDNYLYLRFELADGSPGQDHYYLMHVWNLPGLDSAVYFGLTVFGPPWTGNVVKYQPPDNLSSNGSDCSVTDFVEMRAPFGKLPLFATADISGGVFKSGMATDLFGQSRFPLVLPAAP